MNYVKNEFRSVLNQENLNACMALALTDHTVDTFPFTELLKGTDTKCATFFILYHYTCATFFILYHYTCQCVKL